MKRVAIIADNSIDFVQRVLRIWNNGESAVLIDYRTPCSACLEMIIGAGVSKVYTDRRDLYDYLVQKGSGLITVELMDVKYGVSEINKEIRSLYAKKNDDSEAIILFSSGTTGKSKGIRLSHSAIVTNAEKNAERKGISNDSVLYIYKTLSHCASFIGELVVGLVSGAHIFVSSSKGMIRMHMENISKYGITHISVNPSVIQMIVKNDKGHYDFSSLKLVSCSGALLTEKCFKEARSFFGCDIVNMYGMTEVASLFSCQYSKQNAINEEFKSVGFPLTGNKFRIWNNESNHEANVGEIGEVHVSSTTLMMGYLNENSPALDADGFWHTGDMGVTSKEGELYIIGRKDRMIISCGHNVFPEYIERIIKNADVVEECIVTGIKDSMYGEKIMCMYTAKKGLADIEEQLRQICAKHLAQYEVPHVFKQCDTFRYTSTGKICVEC